MLNCNPGTTRKPSLTWSQGAHESWATVLVSCLVGSSLWAWSDSCLSRQFGPGNDPGYICKSPLGSRLWNRYTVLHSVFLFFSLIAGLHMKKENSLRSEIEGGQEANKRYYSTTCAKMWIRFACLTWAWYLERSNMKHPSYHLVYI